MWNFEHEIDCPDDKAIKSFLWVDYFHDSKILNIDFSEKQDKVTITLDCARDKEDELEKFTGTSTKGLPDKVEERLREYIRNVISKSLTEDYSGKINSWKNTQGQSANSAGANAEALKPILYR